MTNPTTPELAPSPSNALFATTPLPDVQPWTDLAKSPTRPDAFTFALISDRTGFAREGVFERGIAAIDLFNPDFVVQIGDSIEGYTEDIHEIWGQWKQFDEIVAPLEVPLFRTPGNHDVSNEVMSDEWIRRFGALHYAFRYREVLFIVLNTQDPAPKVGETVGGMSSAEFETMLKAMKEKLEQDPSEFIEQVASHQADGAPTGALLSDEQLDWFRATLEANADVRNTIVFMHIPVWEDKSDPQYLAIKEALGERAYTVFGGHLHTY